MRLSDWSTPTWFFVGESDAGETAPEPANGADGVQPETTLRWYPCLAADAYAVFLGTTSELGREDRIVTQSETDLAISGLEPGTRYFWRVDRIIGDSTEEGPVWSFDTSPGYPSLDTAEWRFQDASVGDGVAFEATLGGSTLTPRGMTLGVDWAIDTTDGTSVPHIDGEVASYVMLDNVFGGNRGLQMYFDAPANGGGGFGDVYHFTFIWDLFIESSHGWVLL